MIVAVLLAGFGAVAGARGALPRVELAQGYLEPPPASRVRAPRQSVVAAVQVKESAFIARSELMILRGFAAPGPAPGFRRLATPVRCHL